MINEAIYTLYEGVGTVDAIDTAMRLGVNYPRGPVEWGEELGWGWVTGVLEALTEVDARRYRVPEHLRQYAPKAAKIALYVGSGASMVLVTFAPLLIHASLAFAVVLIPATLILLFSFAVMIVVPAIQMWIPRKMPA